MSEENNNTGKSKNEEINIDVSSGELARSYNRGAMDDNPNYKRILFWSALGFVIFVAFVYMLSSMYQYNRYTTEVDVSANSAYYQIEELNEKEEEILTTYGVVNAEEGIYRIPIDSAINKYIKEN